MVKLIRDLYVGSHIQAVEDFSTRKVLEEMLKAIQQMQKHVFESRQVEPDGLSRNGEISEKMNAVHLRFESKGFSDLIHKIDHGLERVPQGCLFVRQRTTHNECVIEGDEAFGGIDAANETSVTFLIGDPAGALVTALLF